MIVAEAIPDEFGIEGVGGEHGENDHGSEGDGGASRCDRHEVPHLNEPDENGNHEDVDHGPASDEFGEEVDGVGSLGIDGDFAGGGSAEDGEGYEFEAGDHDAGDEDGDGDGVGFHLPKGSDSTEDGAFFFGPELGHEHDGEDVGGNVGEDAGEAVGEAA